MLKAIEALPADKKIAGVHCIPLMENGDMVMAWDREEQLLTTIGGRIDREETIEDALERESMEEVGMVIKGEKIPFASWYWESTDTYTIWFFVEVQEFLSYSFDYEKSGYVIFNFETAKQLISKLEPNNTFRMDLLSMAYDQALKLHLIKE